MKFFSGKKNEEFNKASAAQQASYIRDLERAYNSIEVETIAHLQNKIGVKATPEILGIAIGMGYPFLVERALEGGAKPEREHLLQAAKNGDKTIVKTLVAAMPDAHNDVKKLAAEGNTGALARLLSPKKPQATVRADYAAV